MTAQDFQRYLEQPRLLYDFPLDRLQQLAMRYPYSANLRLLLLLKTHLEGHPDEANYLNRCAAAAFDRAFVYDLLREADLVSAPPEAEEFLELKTLDDLVMEEARPDTTPEQAMAAPNPNYADLFPDEVTQELDATDDEPPGAPEAEQPPVPPVLSGRWVGGAAAYLDALPAWSPAPSAELTTAGALAPEPVSHFTAGQPVGAEASLRERLLRIRRIQASKLADEQEEVRQIARRSLVTQEAVASETLAQLLVRQGQYQNAIKMYRRLELLYPEKKTIFAGLIKDLKEKL